MIGLELPSTELNILCIGAHPDDIEIGCGGTLLKLQQTRKIHLTWVVMTGGDTQIRRDEEYASANMYGAKLWMCGIRDGFLPAHYETVKEELQKFQSKFDIIFCPWRGDAHQDHRLLGELVHPVFRDHLILEYEIPKFDGDLGRPNVFVPLDPSILAEKGTHLMKSFPSQQDKPWFDLEVFDGLARLRGVECRSDYAEAFYGTKICVSI